jgi:hypothetical protein
VTGVAAVAGAVEAPIDVTTSVAARRRRVRTDGTNELTGDTMSPKFL